MRQLPLNPLLEPCKERVHIKLSAGLLLCAPLATATTPASHISTSYRSGGKEERDARLPALLINAGFPEEPIQRGHLLVVELLPNPLIALVPVTFDKSYFKS